MKSKATSALFTLLAAVAILLVLNYIVSGLNVLNFRADLTEKKIFTLSEGTRNIISRIHADEPVTIRFYATQDSRIMPQEQLTYSKTVRDLLLEVEKQGGGRIKLETIDARSDTEEEERAMADQVPGVVASRSGEKFYMGIAVEAVGKKEIVPFLRYTEEVTLEYHIARALSKVTTADRDRPVVGLMSAMPIGGPALNIPGMAQRQPPAWVAVRFLKQDYEVIEVPTNVETIDPKVKVLLMIHPSDLTPKTEFAIDQFLLRGGRIVAFLDPACRSSQMYNNQGQLGMMAPSFVSPTSDLPHLLKAWGIFYNPGDMLADMEYVTQTSQHYESPTVLTIGRAGMNMDEPTTSSLEGLLMVGAGAFAVNQKEGISVVRLIDSSANSGFVDKTSGEQGFTEPIKGFQPDGKVKSMGLRLTGRFATAFPDGPPKAAAPPEGAPTLPGETGGEEEKDAGAPAKPAGPAAADFLKASRNDEGMVFLFSDVDMLSDIFALNRDQQGNLQAAPGNSNIPLLFNVVDMSAGGIDLIAVRSRGMARREFTKINEMMADVEKKYVPILEGLAKERDEVIQEIATLSSGTKQGNVTVITPNEEQLQKLYKKQVEIQKKERDAAKELNRDRDKLNLTITVLNIAAVPVLVGVFGLVLALRRRSLQAAH